jgi:hypothetical protein
MLFDTKASRNLKSIGFFYQIENTDKPISFL